MRRLEFEAASLDAAMRVAIEEFQVSSKYIQINILEERQESFRVEALMTDNLKEVITMYLNDVLVHFNIPFTVKVEENDRGLIFNIETNNNPILIGRDGKTLSAIQFMCKQVSYVFSDVPQNITIDVGGYKERRILQLEILATKTAKEVAKSKIEAKLKPMNSYERRIVHAKLTEWRDVETVSMGEEPNRYLVIRPAKKES
jgi:spoIIIJ-associated protein